MCYSLLHVYKSLYLAMIRSGLEEAINFNWTNHKESVGLVAKQ